MTAHALEPLGIPSHKPLGYGCVHTSTLLGLAPHRIVVEVSCTRGPPNFQMVGLAEAPVREARVRIDSALSRLGVLLNEYAVVVNLAPADLPKSSAALDLALATAVLTAIGKLPKDCLSGLLLLGELSLDGELQPLRGVLPHLHGALCSTRLAGPSMGAPDLPSTDARSCLLQGAIVPVQNEAEAGLIAHPGVLMAHSLEEVVEHLRGSRTLPAARPTEFRPARQVQGADLGQVMGQPAARRALEVAAAGGHNLLMVGPPGAGKTLLARCLPSILPPLRFEEALEVTSIHSVCGLVRHEKGVVDERPFRAPHHSVSEAGLVGGGSPARPGEVSLSHHGVLFLDELPEFRGAPLEALRQPLEDGLVAIARAKARAQFPARPLVIAAMNPCPCGYLNHPNETCRCSPSQVARYRRKLSGPLLDRLDIHVWLPPVDVRTLSAQPSTETSEQVRSRVLAARQRQLDRQQAGKVSRTGNAQLSLDELRSVAPLDATGRRFLESACSQLGLSARAYVKVLRVARTIADLEGSERVHSRHVAEAVQGRILDRRS